MLTRKIDSMIRTFEDNSRKPQYARLKSLLHGITLLCAEYKRLVNVKHNLTRQRYNIGTSPHDMEYSYDDGRTSEPNGGAFGSRTREDVDIRNGLDATHPEPIKLQTAIDEYHKSRRTYISDYEALELWALALSTARDAALREEPVSPQCRELLSVLLVSVPHDKWDGLSDYHHSWNNKDNTGFHGEFLNRFSTKRLHWICYGTTSVNYKRKTGGKRARTLREGRELVGPCRHDSRKKPFDNLLPCNKETTMCGRLNRILISSVGSYGTNNDFIKSQNAKFDYAAAILSDQGQPLPLFGEYSPSHISGTAENSFRMRCYIKRNPNCIKYARLVNVHSCGSPSVPTIITNKPVQIGTVVLYGCQIPLYAAECRTSRSNNRQIVIYPGKTSHREAELILLESEWLHENYPAAEHADSVTLAAAGERYQRRLDSSLQRLERQRRTRLSRRQSIAHYARRLIRLGSMRLDDSRKCGNCWPGTQQFAEQLGLKIPGQWNNTFEIDSRTILRAWRGRDYTANNLFYAAIEQSEKRVAEHKARCIADNAHRLDLCHSL